MRKLTINIGSWGGAGRYLLYLLAFWMVAISSCSEGGRESVPEPPPVVDPPVGIGCWEGFNPQSDYMAVIGDVQSYVSESRYIPYFQQSMSWLAGQKRLGANIVSMLFVGDLTDNNSHAQWCVFKDCSSLASGDIMMVAVSGNHDYDWNRKGDRYDGIRDRRTCHLTQYASTPLLQENIEEAFTLDSIDNIVVRQELAGRRIDIVALEFGVRPEVLARVARHVSSHPERRYIVMTHELLNRNGTFVQNSYSWSQFHDYSPCSTPEDVWEHLVYPNDNVIAMVCGHNGFAAVNTEKINVAGRAVPIVLFNLQYLDNGGNGLVQLWEFPRDTNDVVLRVVDTGASDYFTPPVGMDPPCCEFPIRFSYN